MPQTPNIKLPPQDLEAEHSVLGALLINKDAIFKITDFLTPEDFYKNSHAIIYETIIGLFEKREPIDILSVTSRLKERDLLKKVGGSAYLAEMINSVPSAAHIEHYAKIVREKKILRDLISTSAEITENAFNHGGDLDEVLDKIEQKVFAISQNSPGQKFFHIGDELPSAYERIEKIHKGDVGFRGVPSGFISLDNYLSGFQRADLIILGARPSLGKTAFALDIARHVAVHENKPVGIFSLEMSRDQVIDRVIAAEAGVSLWELRSGRLKNEMDFQMIQQALDRLSAAPLYIYDVPSMNILQMRSMARRLQSEKGLDLLVVDYLQLIYPRTNFESMVQQVTEISRGLKSLARELNVPVLAISQLSRNVEQREIKIPRLSDLRESGSLEQDADVILFIYKKSDSRAATAPEEDFTEILIAKHRNGPLGSVKLKFDTATVKFMNVDRKHVEEI
ncbi:replicative DNA helicase [Candidatus Wolfebacteria bacterium RIFCSPLOWO2_01_FULL_45_19]|uniref:Replicative DNA helicase n=1 Tax=Candidatus Wolfebacteria bacterium RIFCSPLOWO2_01_FULL_45_19 TaxID=1802557 RepID=A0A1F8DUR9_9BACT|nr:MAG: Primary replicative DNA helicase [Parcubacteria group bacterium GW2011_GWB1_45_9]OGM91729.1 MAG: replicative DNA helicase [Candidatus Wolfebacteria bacterium RIFCSPLOWO2_01_FULL_45_19]